MDRSDLKPGYVDGEGAAVYLNSTTRKVALFRQHKLLKFAKLGKTYVYKLSWLDDFMETWAGYDLSNESKIINAIAERDWRQKHGYDNTGSTGKAIPDKQKARRSWSRTADTGAPK